MEITFSYIRNRISEYKKKDIFDYCYSTLEQKKDNHFPIWSIFVLMKWTFKYGGNKYPSKELTHEKFLKLCDTIFSFGQDHVSVFLKSKEFDKAFSILFNQQFYLQKSVYTEIFATQLKLFSKLRSKYDIESSFKEKTGLSISDFIFIEKIVWFYIEIEKLKKEGLYFDGYLDDHFLNLTAGITSPDKVRHFLKLLTLNPNNVEESISNFRHNINKEEFQTMEMSFFTMFPFQIYNGKFRLIHRSIFKNVINYYLYNFLKQHDEKFTTEFGYRIEKYIELGLKELNLKYKTETELKKILPPQSNLVDFYISEENIFIECKASELQAYSSVNPTNDNLFQALESSIFKAYFKQLISVSKQISPLSENWGIIITYKELYWHHFKKLFDIGKDRFEEITDFNHLPSENVFIIDVYTWNKVVQIVKDKKSTLSDILRKARENNSDPTTSMSLFDMHLDQYNLGTMNLSYLQEEIKELDLKNSDPIS